MNKKINIAIVGATGAVGETFVEILQQRNFPVENFIRWPVSVLKAKSFNSMDAVIGLKI